MIALQLDPLREAFGDRLIENAPLAKYTSARIGGPADAMIIANSADHLAEIVSLLWRMGAAFLIMGGGSNILVSDAGVRSVVVLNQAKKTAFDENSDPPTVFAESGSNFGAVARQSAQHGLSGLEWAAGIPGTVGGAVVGNAGAHGSDLASHLKLAEILHLDKGRQIWTVDQFAFRYRGSVLKDEPTKAVALSATLNLSQGKPEDIQGKMDEFLAYRRRTQPPGASMGSMFKNPPDGYAGRLIDEAGLKGHRIGDAQISDLHANFFINHGKASAQDVYNLIQAARDAVLDLSGIELELEIELFGDWKEALA